MTNAHRAWIEERYRDGWKKGYADEHVKIFRNTGTGRILNRRNTLEVESAVTRFKKGDILFGKLRPYLEEYYEAEFDGKCTGEMLAFKPVRIAGRFLFYCVASPWFIQRCSILAYGAKMPRVNWPTLDHIIFNRSGYYSFLESGRL